MSAQELAQMIPVAIAVLGVTWLVWIALIRPAPARRIVVGLFLALTLAPGVGWGQESSLPNGVPDLLNPQVVRAYALVGAGTLFGDPDFPVIVLRRRGDGMPAQILVVLDARNGKSTWSLREDPVIYALVFDSGAGPTVSFVDEGFLATGHASGVFSRRENLSSVEASDLLRRGIERSEDQASL